MALRSIASLLLLVVTGISLAQDPCAGSAHRALILSGGGVKGAFEVGAIVHLVADRSCDFQEVSGISVGGLNAAFLAQARADAEPAMSRAELAKQAEALVQLWRSLRGSRDIYHPRRLASLKLALGTADSFNDFKPLYGLIQGNISVERLRNGRTLRVGVVAIRKVKYREVVSSGGVVAPNFLDYVYAGAVLPIVGRPPRIMETGATVQYGDASLRHITPILSYFRLCGDSASASPVDSKIATFATCDDKRIPPHQPIEQLFVVLTSPYKAGSDVLPQIESGEDEGAAKTSVTQQIPHVIAALNDNTYRTELDLALFANNVLAWQEAVSMNVQAVPFHLDSYNSGRPYQIAVVAPNIETVEFRSTLEFSPERISQLMHDGCVAADKLMHERYHLESMIDACERRFPTPNNGPPGSKLAKAKQVGPRVARAGR